MNEVQQQAKKELDQAKELYLDLRGWVGACPRLEKKGYVRTDWFNACWTTYKKETYTKNYFNPQE